MKLDRILVDTGASCHFLNDIERFKSFDGSPEATSEFQNGTKGEGDAQQKGTAVVYLLDNSGKQHRAELQGALYISSYPHNIFSVARATTRGVTIPLVVMVTKDGSRFDISQSRNLFYLADCGAKTLTNVSKVSHDVA